jgi:hypothetical protein
LRTQRSILLTKGRQQDGWFFAASFTIRCAGRLNEISILPRFMVYRFYTLYGLYLLLPS